MSTSPAREFFCQTQKKTAGIVELCRDFLTKSDEKKAALAQTANKSAAPKKYYRLPLRGAAYEYSTCPAACR